jgi:anti-anti-sigma factor
MSSRITQGDSGSAPTVRIEGEMTIYRANDLKRDIVGCLERAADIELDLSGVTELDTAGVQLLLLARREADHRGGVARITALSPAVQEVFALCRLTACPGRSGAARA